MKVKIYSSNIKKYNRQKIVLILFQIETDEKFVLNLNNFSKKYFIPCLTVNFKNIQEFYEF